MSDADEKTINLVEAFKIADAAIKAYKGSPRLLAEVTACVHKMSEEYDDLKGRSEAEITEAIEKQYADSIVGIRGTASYAIVHGLLSQKEKDRDEEKDFGTLVMEEEIGGSEAAGLLHNFAHDLFCTKKELAVKLDDIYRSSRPSGDRASDRAEDMLAHQEEAHSALLAETAKRAIEAAFGIRHVAGSSRVDDSDDLPPH